MIYVNHAGTSWPKPPEVARAFERTLAADPREAGAIFEAARAEVCDYLGIRDPERFLFTTGCTASLALALGDLPWRPGDTVITSALEHHALARPVQQLVAHRGVRHAVAPYRPGRPVDLDFVRDTLRKNETRTRLVAASAASNVTGELLPVRELATLAHEHDALMLVDAAQTVGILPTDVHDLGADLLVFAGHKGPMGPQGVGGLWAASHVEFESPGASCEIRRPADPGTAPACATFPGYCDAGAVNLAAAAALAAGIAWRRRHPAAEARRLAHEFAQAAARIDGCEVFASDAERTTAVSLRIEALETHRAEAHFAARDIVVRAGEHCAPLALEAIGAPHGTVRVSFGPGHTPADRRAVLAAIEEAARASNPR